MEITQHARYACPACGKVSPPSSGSILSESDREFLAERGQENSSRDLEVQTVQKGLCWRSIHVRDCRSCHCTIYGQEAERGRRGLEDGLSGLRMSKTCTH